MFEAYFDAGGHKADQPCLSVAGFISTADEWRAFAAEWNRRLGGLDVFHASRDKGRHDLVPDLVELISRTAFVKFGQSIRFDVFAALPNLSKRVSANYRLNAYALCAMQCVEMVNRWAREQSVPRERVRFVFEEGDIGKGLLINLMRASGYPAPAFEYKQRTPVRGGGFRPAFVPLQAADLLANDLFDQTRSARNDPVRLSHRELEIMPGFVGSITRPMVEEYVAYLRSTPGFE